MASWLARETRCPPPAGTRIALVAKQTQALQLALAARTCLEMLAQRLHQGRQLGRAAAVAHHRLQRLAELQVDMEEEVVTSQAEQVTAAQRRRRRAPLTAAKRGSTAQHWTGRCQPQAHVRKQAVGHQRMHVVVAALGVQVGQGL